MARYSDNPLNVRWDRLARRRPGRRRRLRFRLLAFLLVVALVGIALTLPPAREEAVEWLNGVGNLDILPTIRDGRTIHDVTDADSAHGRDAGKLITLLDLRSITMCELTPLTTRFLIVAGAGVVLLCCLIMPRVGRVFARIVAVLGIGTGIGALTWGICATVLGEAIRSPIGLEGFIAEPSEAIGWGAGLLAGGITALAISFVGTKKQQ
jgi:hypothetical protein